MAKTETIKFGPFNWRELQRKGETALVITEGIIEMGPYHTEEKGTTWENCAVRKYLNGKFLEKFSPAEKERIVEVTNQNSDNPWYSSLAVSYEGKQAGLAGAQKGGNPTNDKIFLLSIEEACSLFGNSTARLKNKGFTQKGKSFVLDDPKTPNMMSYLIIISDQNDKNRAAAIPASLSPKRKTAHTVGGFALPENPTLKPRLSGKKAMYGWAANSSGQKAPPNSKAFALRCG
jgi:hypothetical protein